MSSHWAQEPKGNCTFEKMTGRDKLFERMHGIPTVTREEKAATDKKNKAHVSFIDYLPNSVKKSAKESYFSASTKTKEMGLFNCDDHSTV